MSQSGEALRARLHDTGAHPAIVESVVDTGQLQAILAEDARDTGEDEPGRDYAAEAEQMAPVVLLAMLQAPTAEEVTATAAAIAAFHAAA